MELNGKQGIGILILAIVTILIGLPLFDSIADSVNEATTAITATNRSFTLSGGSATLTGYSILSISAIRNDSMVNYQAACNTSLSAKTIQCPGLNFTDNKAYVDYVYGREGYVAESTSRTILPLLLIFFAIAILLIAVAYGMGAFRGMGFG